MKDGINRNVDMFNKDDGPYNARYISLDIKGYNLPLIFKCIKTDKQIQIFTNYKLDIDKDKVYSAVLSFGFKSEDLVIKIKYSDTRIYVTTGNIYVEFGYEFDIVG